MDEARCLAGALRNLRVTKRVRYGWYAPALDTIDCVLSLNRPYYSFVVPRVEGFAENRPDVRTLAELKALIKAYPSPLAFSIAELRYRHADRAATLLGVVNYLDGEVSKFSGRTERERLKKWAQRVVPADHKAVGVRGFGLAGFQYLRMLFGVQTVKPDVHIKRFVSKCLRRRVSDVESIMLLEQAARDAHLRLRDADNAIWRKLAKVKRCPA